MLLGNSWKQVCGGSSVDVRHEWSPQPSPSPAVGAEVEAVNRDRLTLLHLAILREREEAGMFLLESGASFQRM